MRPRHDHRLGANKREWTPGRIVVFDTETTTAADDDGADLNLRCWTMCMVRRDVKPGRPRVVSWWDGLHGHELASVLDKTVTTTSAHWAFAHNLGFDLTTTRLPEHLTELGWEWTQGTVTAASPWMRWSKGNRGLTLADSFSHLPTSVERIGEQLGMPKLRRPADDAPLDEWLRYCRRDVEIIVAALVQLLDWWDAEQLGSFSVTGAQTGWNAMRHRKPSPDVHIDVDTEPRDFARAASYGGRRQVWRVGDLVGGPWAEIDMALAHAHICRDELLPVATLGWLESVPPKHPVWTDGRVGLIADCTVRTEEARWPLWTDAGVLYPVGEFRTRLAWPELQEARRRGELVDVGRALALALGRPMETWAAWVIAELASPPTPATVGPWLAMKGWSRATVGKWASRSAREVLNAAADGPGFRVEAGFYQHPDVPAWTVSLGGRCRVFVRDQDADDAFPAVYAFVCSYQRLALDRLVEMVGREHVVQCNTDSVVCEARNALYAAEDTDDPLPGLLDALRGPGVDSAALPPLAVKALADHLRIRTPEHWVLGDGEHQRRRLASVPRGAVETDPWVFAGDVWPGLPQQLQIGRRETFRLQHRTVDLSGARPLGWVDVLGRVLPPRFHVAGGVNVLERPQLVGWADAQHPGLLGLLDASGSAQPAA